MHGCSIFLGIEVYGFSKMLVHSKCVGIQNCGSSKLWVLKIYGYTKFKIYGYSNLCVFQISGYLKFIDIQNLRVLKYGSKFVGRWRGKSDHICSLHIV